MKLKKLYEQVVGHWKTFDSPYHMDPKHRKSKTKKDLSFRIKGKKKISKSKKKDPEGGEDKTQALETGAGPIGYGKSKKIGMKGQPGDPKGGSDRLHGSGRIAGGELNAWRGNKSKGINLKRVV
jgi:hypothetical protein